MTRGVSFLFAPQALDRRDEGCRNAAGFIHWGLFWDFEVLRVECGLSFFSGSLLSIGGRSCNSDNVGEPDQYTMHQ